MNWAETNIKVRYQETDQMGVVYHSNYFIWFEVGRTEMIRNIGITYREMEEKGLILPVVDANCSYKNSAKYDDDLIIKTKISNYNGLRLDFDYEVMRVADNQLLAKGQTKHVWIDNNYKPIRLDKVEPGIDKKIRNLLIEGD